MAVCASPTAVHTRKLALHDRCPVASAASHLFDAAKTMEQVHHQDLKAVKVQFKSNLPGKFSCAHKEQDQAVWRGSLVRLKFRHNNGGSGA